MSNYDLEELKLLKYQYGLTILLMITLFISLSLTKNEILKYNRQVPLYSRDEETDILRFNRIIGLIVSLGFLFINVRDRFVKEEFNQGNLKNANLQINSSLLSLVSTIIVLYVAFSGEGDVTSGENP